MFNNDMNNNENFNNGNLSFENQAFNQMNNQGGYVAPTFDNNVNNQNLNDETPLFSNQTFNQGNDMNFSRTNNMPLFNNSLPNSFQNETSSLDVPPELDPIKNLNDAVESTAPTLDVLGPMNIMPDVLPQANDKLDAYENGTYDINNQTLNANPLEQNSYQPGNNNIYNSSNNFNNNMIQNINEPIQNFNPVQESPVDFSASINHNSVDTDFSNIGSNYEPINTALNNNINVEQPNNVELPSMDYGINNDLPISNLKPEIESTINPLNQNETETQVVNSLDNINNISDTIALNTNGVTESAISEPDLVQDVVLSEIEEENKLDNINEEVQATEDLNTNAQKTFDTTLEETNLSDLGLDESYTEPDALEIMDLENEIKEENDTSDESSVSQGLVSDNVEKIKALIEELKKSGVDIEVEEFDFESMYQLIVKLKK